MPDSFQTTRRVEFRDTDAAGIVHFSVFINWMEEAEHELLRSLGMSVFAHDEVGPITWPRVSVRCDYQSSLRFEDSVQIDVRVLRMGDRSVTYDFHFSGARGAVASGEITAVCCRLGADGKLRSISIPAWIQEKLAPLLVA